MLITITINTSNAAFGEDKYDEAQEVARILREFANDYQDGDVCTSVATVLRDHNGNPCGRVEVEA